MITRFICRFKPSMEETLSVYNANYEWASTRKKHRRMFTLEGWDNNMAHTSQLIFLCPVPSSLVETKRTGNSVKDDSATLFVDVIPIRTPPRYGRPNEFLPPYYQQSFPKKLAKKNKKKFDSTVQWGDNHLLPRIEDSGRWENIPICKPSLMTYGNDHDKEEAKQEAAALKNAITTKDKASVSQNQSPPKKHRLISCLWASTGYATRGNRFAINDGQRRLLEWITYNKLIGVDHFYLYDNSAAFSTGGDASLKPIADMFPNDVTYINWPSQVCNNNPNNVDSVGERSSQYAAESSCRLRFGPHADWIIHFDIGALLQCHLTKEMMTSLTWYARF